MTEPLSQATHTTHDADNFANVLDNFDALLRGADFTNELHILGIGRMNVFARRAMLTELRALYIALWHLALLRSFPDTADSIYAAFLERIAHAQNITRKDLLCERIEQYKDMLHATGDRDFMAVSRHLLSMRHIKEGTLKPLNLRLALHLRATYTLIFDRLI